MSDLTFAARPVAMELFDAGLNSRGAVDLADLSTWNAKRGEFGYRWGQFKVPFDAELLRESYNGTTLYEDGGLGWGVRFYYGADKREFADVALVICQDDDLTEGGQNLDDIGVNVTFEGLGWIDWFLGAKEVMTQVLARWIKSGGVDAATGIVALIQENIDDSRRPTLYAMTGQSRADFGPFDVAVAQDGISDTLLPPVLRIDHGRSLIDTVRELCRIYDCTLSGEWGGTGARGLPLYTITVHASRGIDRAGTVVFSRNSGTLRRSSFKTDWTAPSGIGEAKGKATRERQKVGYAFNPELIARFGTREGPEVWDSAWDGSTDELTREQLWLMGQYGVQFSWCEAAIAEDADELAWGTHFDVEDITDLNDERKGKTWVERITELELASHSPAILYAVHGRRPFDAGTAGSLLAKGGWGHRRHGYHAWPIHGEQEVFQRICCDEVIDNTVVNATQANTRLKIIHDEDVPNNGIWTKGVNNGELEEKIGEVRISDCPCDMTGPDPTGVATDVCVTPTCSTTVTATAEEDCCTPEFPANSHFPIYWTTPCDCDGYIDLSGVNLNPCCVTPTINTESETTCDEACDTISIPTWPFDSWAGECVRIDGVYYGRKVPGFITEDRCAPLQESADCPPVNG